MAKFSCETFWRIILAFKRLIGVITVKDGQVVKSYGYRFWRPAGGLGTALKNLDRWQVDEILVLDISGREAPEPALVREIKNARISTPLTYGGGIHRPEHVDELLAAGCERFVLETMAFAYPERVAKLADRVGAQALIASMPCVQAKDDAWSVKPGFYRSKSSTRDAFVIEEALKISNDLPVAEVLAIDRNHEGYKGRFSILSAEGKHPFQNLQKGIIWFGGLDLKKAINLMMDPSTVAVGVGHINFEREVAMRLFRRSLLKADPKASARKTHGLS
jgi:cyclase